MILHQKFAIGHIPKTGGHAVSVMLSKVTNLKYMSPFEIKGNRAFSTNVYKHSTFKDIEKDGIDLKERELVLVMRRLPIFVVSYLWHQSVSTEQTEKKGVHKVAVGQTYDRKWKDKQGFLFLPRITCHFNFPDVLLKKWIEGYEDKITWLKMEKLSKDLIHFIQRKIRKLSLPEQSEIRKLGYFHSYKKSYPDPYRYWSQDTINILYKNNPLWASVEKKVYGNLLQINNGP